MLTPSPFLSSSMEAVLVQDCNALDDMSGLVMRSNALLSDVQAHLDEVVLTQGASVSDLDRAVEEGAQAYHDRIHALVMPAQAALAGRKMLEAPQLTASHIALLSARQSRAVLSYVDQVMSLQCKTASSTDETSPRPQHHDEAVSFTPTSPQSSTSWPPSFDLFSRPSRENKLILAHAYVRYMGDLSGGQHIVKRLSKLFPIHHASDTSSPHLGFQFYSFASTGKTSMELKEMIRSRMDAVEMDEHDVQMVIDEASLAFCLNRGLLDSLVAEDSTDTPTSMASAVRPASSPLDFLHTLLQLVSSCKALQFALLAIVALASLLLSQ